MADLGRGALGEAAEDGDRIAGGGRGGIEVGAIHGVKLPWINFLEVANRCGDVVAKVMNNPFYSTAVKQVAVGVGEFRLEHPPNAPPSDGIGEGKSQQAHDGGEHESGSRPV